jgi:hypothetical protein
MIDPRNPEALALHAQAQTAIATQPTTLAGSTAQPARRQPQNEVLFVCYRRDDTQHAVDRLRERLVQAYGSERVFMDIDSIPLGVNLVAYISEQLRRCAAVLVIIGKHWLNATDDDNRRRLDDAGDHVRVEIVTALSQGVPVIPLLLDARMPKATELPEDIRNLALHNGMDLPRAHWNHSVERLLTELDKMMNS